MALHGSRRDSSLPGADPSALTGDWVDDPFSDPGLDDSGDTELVGLFDQANRSVAHQTTALSALSAQMDVYRPLSPEDQQVRLEAYNAGLMALARYNSDTGLSEREREHLQHLIRLGENAQTELVGSMFRLVLVIARELSAKRYGRERSMDVLADLVAEANVSLVEAVNRYDASRGPAFNVYAGRVVRDHIRASLGHEGLSRVPSSWLRVRRLAQTLAPELTLKLGRAPTVEEMQAGLVAQSMRWAEDHLTPQQRELPEAERHELMKAKLVKQGMMGAIGLYEEVMVTTQQLWNLDAPIGTDGASRLVDTVPDATSDETFDAVELTQLREALLEGLKHLPERDREIVLYRFGFLDGETWTYAKLAPRYNISPERVRQIERSALAKLRGPGFDAIAAFLPSSN